MGKYGFFRNGNELNDQVILSQFSSSGGGGESRYSIYLILELSLYLISRKKGANSPDASIKIILCSSPNRQTEQKRANSVSKPYQLHTKSTPTPLLSSPYRSGENTELIQSRYSSEVFLTKTYLRFFLHLALP